MLEAGNRIKLQESLAPGEGRNVNCAGSEAGRSYNVSISSEEDTERLADAVKGLGKVRYDANASSKEPKKKKSMLLSEQFAPLSNTTMGGDKNYRLFGKTNALSARSDMNAAAVIQEYSKVGGRKEASRNRSRGRGPATVKSSEKEAISKQLSS